MKSQDMNVCFSTKHFDYKFIYSMKAKIKALISLQAISDMVTEEHLAEGRLYPPLNTIREVSFKIAVKVSLIYSRM